ncbi:MAG TPA: ATP-binding cassette domain-containing protein [Halomicronema sp.]
MPQNNKIDIHFQNVYVTINNREVLSDLNFSVRQGEALILLGRSGSGKTTTMKLINNLLIPSSGEVIVQGQSTRQWNPIELRRKIGYVIQEVGLFPHFTIEQNVGLIPSLQGWKPKQIKSRVYELLNLMGLDPEKFAKRYPNQLSGGQRQRVGVLRALAADPPIMLMDEPFGALDPITRVEIQKEFKRLQRDLGKTVVFVTHDIQEAFILGSRIGLMDNGKMIFLGTPTEFLKSEEPESQAFLSCLKIMQETSANL